MSHSCLHVDSIVNSGESMTTPLNRATQIRPTTFTPPWQGEQYEATSMQIWWFNSVRHPLDGVLILERTSPTHQPNLTQTTFQNFHTEPRATVRSGIFYIMNRSTLEYTPDAAHPNSNPSCMSEDLTKDSEGNAYERAFYGDACSAHRG